MGWNYLSIPKLQRCNRWSLGMDKLFHPTHYRACDYLSMLGLKLNHVSKRGPGQIFKPGLIMTVPLAMPSPLLPGSYETSMYQWEGHNSFYTNSKVHGANMGPIWGRQDPGGPHVGPMNFAIWVVEGYLHSCCTNTSNTLLLKKVWLIIRSLMVDARNTAHQRKQMKIFTKINLNMYVS